MGRLSVCLELYQTIIILKRKVVCHNDYTARSREHGVSCVAHDSFFNCVGSAEHSCGRKRPVGLHSISVRAKRTSTGRSAPFSCDRPERSGDLRAAFIEEGRRTC